MCSSYSVLICRLNNMKKKILMYVLLVPVMLFSISHRVRAQASPGNEGNTQTDSLTKVKDDQEKDLQNLSDLKSEQRTTKAKAREAQRIEQEAMDAARES